MSIIIVVILTLVICFLYAKNTMRENFKGIKVKIVLFLSVTMFLYLSIELFYPRDFQVKGSIEGSSTILKLEKLEKDNYYYISFNKIKLECTKEQYYFLDKGKECYIYYRLNFFNRKTGKILKLDDKPIYYGNIRGASNIIAYQISKRINCYF